MYLLTALQCAWLFFCGWRGTNASPSHRSHRSIPARAAAVAGSLRRPARLRSSSLCHVRALVLGPRFPPLCVSQVWSSPDTGLARLLVLRHVRHRTPLVGFLTAYAVSGAKLFEAQPRPHAVVSSTRSVSIPAMQRWPSFSPCSGKHVMFCQIRFLGACS